MPRHFVLYGGTAVALRLAHRNSVDFDFFTEQSFDPLDLRQSLVALGEARILQAEPNTLTLLVDRGGDIKLSCFGGIEGRVGCPDVTADGVLQIASPLDLLARKLKVILQRAEGRDYQDIAALVRSGVSLETAMGAAASLFAPGFPLAEAAKALTYFGDISESWRLNDNDRSLLIAAASQLSANIPPEPLASRALAIRL